MHSIRSAGIGGLEHHALRRKAVGGEQLRVVHPRRQHDDGRRPPAFPQLAQDIEARAVGHVDVEEQQVGLQLLDLRERVRSRCARGQSTRSPSRAEARRARRRSSDGHRQAILGSCGRSCEWKGDREHSCSRARSEARASRARDRRAPSATRARSPTCLSPAGTRTHCPSPRAGTGRRRRRRRHRRGLPCRGGRRWRRPREEAARCRAGGGSGSTGHHRCHRQWQSIDHCRPSRRASDRSSSTASVSSSPRPRRSAETKLLISPCSSISKRFSSCRSVSNCSPGARTADDRFDPECGARKELHDAVVDVPRQRKPGARRGALLDRGEERVAVEHRAGRMSDLLSQVEEIDREVGNVPQHEPAALSAGRDRRDEALARAELAERLANRAPARLAGSGIGRWPAGSATGPSRCRTGRPERWA